MKARFVIAFLAMAVLCFNTVAQDNTTGYWMNRAEELMHNGYESHFFLLVFALLMIIISEYRVYSIAFTSSPDRCKSSGKENSSSKAGTTFRNFVSITVELTRLIDARIDTEKSDKRFRRVKL